MNSSLACRRRSIMSLKDSSDSDAFIFTSDSSGVESDFITGADQSETKLHRAMFIAMEMRGRQLNRNRLLTLSFQFRYVARVPALQVLARFFTSVDHL